MQSLVPSFLMSGALGSLLLLLIAVAVLVTVPFLRRIAWTGVKLFPAAGLFLLGVFAILFWKPVEWLGARIPGFSRAGGRFVSLVDALASRSADPLIAGKREAVAKSLWPEARFPTLYTEVPDDIRRPLWEDGRLVGGRGIPWMADRHFSEGMNEAAGKTGLTAALMTFLIPPLGYVLHVPTGLFHASTGGSDSGRVLLEQFPHEPLVYVSGWTVWSSVLGDTVGSALRAVASTGGFLIAWLVISLGAGLLVAVAAIEFWRRQQAAPYEIISKDAHVRWAYRAESRAVVQTSYAKQVAHATGYLKDSPLFVVGTGTGTLRVRGDLAAPLPGQTIALDRESLFQHLLVFGGTGDGKTTAVLKPILRQVLQHKEFGVYVTDAKGVLWRDAESLARAAKREADVIRIGTGSNEYGVDLCARLTPSQISATLRSVLQQMGGGGHDSFWPDMAANTMRHMLTIGRAYALTPQGHAEAKSGLHPYSLWWAYRASLDEERVLKKALVALTDEKAARVAAMQAAIDTGGAAFDAAEKALLALSTPDMIASHEYLTSAWAAMADATKTGIVANISQLMDGFAAAPVLRERFASGPTSRTVRLDAALNGKIVLVTLSTMEEGLPARLVAILLKTALYREARLREAEMKAAGQGSPQDRPCLVMMDEVQEIVTVDPSSGLSDATFWNVARSTGLAGVFATQTVAALVQAMGKDAAENFLQQARSKVFLRSEEADTVSHACWCAGEYERNRVYEQGQWESLDQRKLVEGWTPFDDIDTLNDPLLKTQGNFFFSAARQMISQEAIGAASARRIYEADRRFVPTGNDPGTRL